MSLVRKRLLFVDDEPGIRRTLPAILSKYGFAVTVTATVSEAMGEITKQSFDLLLCDLNLEREHDGFEVVHAMRDAHPNAVVIILTAYPDVDSAIQSIREQIDDYVIKPSNPNSLVATLANNLSKKRALNPGAQPVNSSLTGSVQ